MELFCQILECEKVDNRSSVIMSSIAPCGLQACDRFLSAERVQAGGNPKVT